MKNEECRQGHSRAIKGAIYTYKYMHPTSNTKIIIDMVFIAFLFRRYHLTQARKPYDVMSYIATLSARREYQDCTRKNFDSFVTLLLGCSLRQNKDIYFCSTYLIAIYVNSISKIKLNNLSTVGTIVHR